MNKLKEILEEFEGNRATEGVFVSPKAYAVAEKEILKHYIPISEVEEDILRFVRMSRGQTFEQFEKDIKLYLETTYKTKEEA